MAITAYSYDDNARREDLLDILTNLTPTETQLMSGLQMSTARDISHQWVKDTLDTVGANAQIEGADPTYRTLTNPTRMVNYTQILSKPYRVSGTERELNSAGFDDRFTYEREKAFRSFNNDVEYALMRGTLVCGTGSAARSMAGVKGFLASNSYGANNYTSQSGVSLIETMLNDYFQAVWDDGTQVNEVYAPMYLKRKISGFTAGNTKNVKADDKRLILAVDVYQADAAPMVKLFPHRYVTVSGDVNYDLIGIDSTKFGVSWLRSPEVQSLAKTGDADKEQVIGEGCLECRHNEAGFYTKALL